MFIRRHETASFASSTEKTMKNAWILTVLVTLVFTSGCFGPRFSFEIRKVTIETTPPGAKVYQVNSVDGNETFLGTTPVKEQPIRVLSDVKGRLTSASVDWMTSQIQMLNIRIVKTGYEEHKGNLPSLPGKTTTHKITLTPK